MMRLVICAACLMPQVAAAQSATVPVRSLGPVMATSNKLFSPGTGDWRKVGQSPIVVLRDGRVLVADYGRDSVIVLDAKLDNPRGVLAGLLPGSYLSRLGGDTVLFYDLPTRLFTVIAPNGAFVRTMRATPMPADPASANSVTARAVYSPIHGLVFRRPAPPPASIVAQPEPGQPAATILHEDSVHVVRMNLTTSAIEPVARISSGAVTFYRRTADNPDRLIPGRGPPPPRFQFYDAAVVTTDGSIAIFHARNYSLEWLGANGSRQVGPRIEQATQRISDAERNWLLDSINTFRKRAHDSGVVLRTADSLRNGAPTVAGIRISSSGPDSVVRRAAPLPPPLVLATDADIPMFRPTTSPYSVLADGDNNVWICPALPDSEPGFVIWDVVNRQSVVIDRVRVPQDKTIVGFGPGVVYLTAPAVAGMVRIERVRIRAGAM